MNQISFFHMTEMLEESTLGSFNSSVLPSLIIFQLLLLTFFVDFFDHESCLQQLSCGMCMCRYIYRKEENKMTSLFSTIICLNNHHNSYIFITYPTWIPSFVQLKFQLQNTRKISITTIMMVSQYEFLLKYQNYLTRPRIHNDEAILK